MTDIQKTYRELNYHAARLLILISNCGSGVENPQVKGRTLLAKLDFFLRYPTYLNKAAKLIKGKSLNELINNELQDYEKNNVETRMVRYKYGPWDNVYYSVLVYLIAKDLIEVKVFGNVEHFTLTNSGIILVKEISGLESYKTLVLRAKVLKKLFSRWSGTHLKDFIYARFPEVVSLPIGKEI